MRQIVFFLCLAALFSCKQNKVEISSKNNLLKTVVEINEDHKLFYSIWNNESMLIEKSELGLNIDNTNIGNDVEIIGESRHSKDESYAWIGNQNTLHDSYNEVKVELLHRATKLRYFIEIRNFDNGVAFRYVVPSTGTKTILAENTTFTIPNGTKIWYASGPFQYGWLQEYQERDAKDIKGELLAPPATMKLINDGGYMSITEGALYNYHGGVLFGKAPNKMQISFVENKGHVLTGQKMGVPESKYWHEVVYNAKWQQKGDIITPWRIISYGKNLNELVNNNIVSLVNPAPEKELFPKGNQTDWIKPGKSLWTWLTERHQPRKSDPKLYMEYAKKAQELGIDYVTIDEGWYRWKAGDKTNWDILKEVVTEAKKYNVGIWVWKSTSERVGIPGLDNADFREQFLKNCHQVGVKGIKADFFHTENTYTIKVMEDVLRDAAKNKLLVVYHGVNKPTGESRTYPNLLAKEAVRGLECAGAEDSWAPGPPWPYHNTVLPFTRWLVGPADYTPLHFGRWKPKNTTMAHQIASIYMFTSPMTFFAADPEDIETSKAKELISNLPVNWDETYVLPISKIGEIAAIARRKENTWYVTILNGMEAKKVDITFEFLKAGNYNATVVTDEKDGNSIQVEVKKVNNDNPMEVNLKTGGGLLLKIEQ